MEIKTNNYNVVVQIDTYILQRRRIFKDLKKNSVLIQIKNNINL